MKIHELTKEVVGKRVRVIGVAYSEAEANGYVNDTERLMGQGGWAVEFRGHGTLGLSQLIMDWDDPNLGLALAGNDEVEVETDTMNEIRRSTAIGRLHDEIARNAGDG